MGGSPDDVGEVLVTYVKLRKSCKNELCPDKSIQENTTLLNIGIYKNVCLIKWFNYTNCKIKWKELILK